MTRTPDEFKFHENCRIKWVAVKINKSYDFLLGLDWIKNNVSQIDISKRELVLNNGEKINFLNRYVEETVYAIDINEEKTIQLDHLNTKERLIIEKLLKKFNSLLFREGDILTRTNTVVHEIKTTNNEQINSKLYRYPPQQEEEVRRQMK